MRRAGQMAGRVDVRVGRHLPEDLAQTVLTRLLNQYGGDTLRAWESEKLWRFAYRTLHNLAIDEHKRRHERFLAEGDADVGAPDERRPTDAALVERETSSRLQACLGALQAEHRRFVVRAFELDSAPEAQAELGWPPGTGANACHTRNRIVKLLNACMHGREKA